MITRQKTTVSVGDRIYNRGDMANSPHWATITDRETDRLVTSVTLHPDDEYGDYKIGEHMISETDQGNGLTRFVTEAAYNQRRTAEIERMKAACEAVARRYREAP